MIKKLKIFKSIIFLALGLSKTLIPTGEDLVIHFSQELEKFIKEKFITSTPLYQEWVIPKTDRFYSDLLEILMPLNKAMKDCDFQGPLSSQAFMGAYSVMCYFSKQMEVKMFLFDRHNFLSGSHSEYRVLYTKFNEQYSRLARNFGIDSLYDVIICAAKFFDDLILRDYRSGFNLAEAYTIHESIVSQRRDRALKK